MHERSVVKTLLKEVDRIRQQHGAERLSEVRVEVGPLSGIEPVLLSSAFEQLAPESTASGAKLVIDVVTLLAECEPCGRNLEVDDFVFRCPRCGGNVRVIRGDEVQLTSVTFREPSSRTHPSSASPATPKSGEFGHKQEATT